MTKRSREALALVTPSLGERLTKGTLSKEFYDLFIGMSNDSLVKVIRVLGLFLNLRKYTPPLTCQESHLNAFLLLIRSSQKHYPPEIYHKKCHQQEVNELYGVKYIRHSYLESTEKTNLFSQMYPIIGKDAKFLALLIKLAHITDLKVHRNIIGTQAQFMRGFYGVFHLNFKSSD